MNNYIDLSTLPVEPNSNIKNLVALGEDGAIIVAQNGISKEVFEKELKTKQDELISGINIKTINGYSILGNGDLTIETDSSGETIDLSNYVTIGELDEKLSNYITESSIVDLSNKISNIQDLGEVEKSSVAEETAMNPNIATNRNINFIKYSVPSMGKTGIIEQLVKLGDSQGETLQIITWDGVRKFRRITFIKLGNYWNRSNNPTWESVKFLSESDWNNRLSGAVQTSGDQAINGVKTFNNNININNKTTLATNIDSGELKVLHNNSSKGFILRTKNTSDSILPLELLSTNGTSSYQYNFPKSNGNVVIGIKIGNNTYTPSLEDGLIDLTDLFNV